MQAARAGRRGGSRMRTITAVVAGVLLGVSVEAQPPGVVEVVVVDRFEVPVPAAEVVATSLSGYRVAGRTNPSGRAVLSGMVPGSYAVEVAAPGFVPAGEQVTVPEGAGVAVRVAVWPAVPAALSVAVVDGQGLSLPGALVRAFGPVGELREAASGGDGVLVLDDLRPGSWRVVVGLEGFRTAEAEADVGYGFRSELRFPLALAGFGDTVVVTASRTPVRLAEAPVTTSVVSAERISTSPAANVGELLRAVPGVNVVQFSARDLALTSRGATTPAANSQLVLVDGRSVYLDFFGAVLWDSLTVNHDDIAQIEVVRGPASATWGANAMTGAVNIVTAPPRSSVGTRVSMWGGFHDRDAGSTAGAGAGRIFGSNVSVSRAPSDVLAYRISAGHYRSDAFPRPSGRVPRVRDPRAPGATVGGAAYHGIANRGANQVKFDTRIDRRLHGGSGSLSYSGGVATTEGVAHTGLGPFDLQRGGHVGYSKLNYERDALSVQFFTNFLDGEAPSLLLPDAALKFKSAAFDLEVVHRRVVAGDHRLTYGGNARRVLFDVDIAAAADDRAEFAGFIQDEIDRDRYRAVLAARLDKFGNLPTPFLSPRAAFGLKLGPEHVVTASFNRAFRAPSAVEAHMDQWVVVPVDLSALRALRPFLPTFLPPELPPAARRAALGQLESQLDATTDRPFPLRTRAVGGGVDFGGAGADGRFLQESMVAYELSYAGAVSGGATSFGAAVYVNDVADSIGLVPVSLGADSYTAEAPPPGWVLPPQVLTLLESFGAGLPRTSLAYRNLGPLRQVGAEAWLEQRFAGPLQAWVNWSWQARPSIRDSADPYPVGQLNLPPAHRFNVGAVLDGRRVLGNVSVSVSSRAFWADVLTPEYHGYSDAFTLVNGTVGVKWRDGTVTTLVRVTNALNRTIQQHVYGDLLRRSIVGEVRFDLP